MPVASRKRKQRDEASGSQSAKSGAVSGTASRKSKKAQREEAMRRAREWSEKEKAEKDAKKSKEKSGKGEAAAKETSSKTRESGSRQPKQQQKPEKVEEKSDSGGEEEAVQDTKKRRLNGNKKGGAGASGVQADDNSTSSSRASRSSRTRLVATASMNSTQTRIARRTAHKSTGGRVPPKSSRVDADKTANRSKAKEEVSAEQNAVKDSAMELDKRDAAAPAPVTGTETNEKPEKSTKTTKASRAEAMARAAAWAQEDKAEVVARSQGGVQAEKPEKPALPATDDVAEAQTRTKAVKALEAEVAAAVAGVAAPQSGGLVIAAVPGVAAPQAGGSLTGALPGVTAPQTSGSVAARAEAWEDKEKSEVVARRKAASATSSARASSAAVTNRPALTPTRPKRHDSGTIPQPSFGKFKNSGTKPPFGSPLPQMRRPSMELGAAAVAGVPKMPDEMPRKEDHHEAGKGDSSEDESYVDSEADDEELDLEEEEEEEEEADAPIRQSARREDVGGDEPIQPLLSRKGGWFAAFLGVLGVVSVSALLAVFGQEGMTIRVPLLTNFASFMSDKASMSPPCFQDSSNEEAHDYISLAPHCTSETVRAPCPSKSYCSRGFIDHCTSRHYEISESKDSCVLSSVSNETIGSLVDMVHSWTVDNECRFGNDDTHNALTDVQGAEGRPLYSFNELSKVLEIENDLELVLEAERRHILKVERRGDDSYVGLDPSLDLILPLPCMAGKVILGILSALFYVFQSAVSESFDYCKTEYPILSILTSLFGLFVIYRLRRIRRTREERQRVMRDVADIRQMVWERLAETQSSTASIHLRDQIVWERSETSRAGRRHIIKRVWPRVTEDIRQDNRVRKSQELVDGRRCEFWQWIDSNPPKRAQPVTFEEEGE